MAALDVVLEAEDRFCPRSPAFAGRVTERRVAAPTRCSLALHGGQEPWCSAEF